MQQDEKHTLEEFAIALEKASANADSRTRGMYRTAYWSPRTATALRQAGRLLRKALELPRAGG